MKDKTHFCSFCGKSQTEVAQLIAGAGDECVELSMSIVLNHRTEKRPLEAPHKLGRQFADQLRPARGTTPISMSPIMPAT